MTDSSLLSLVLTLRPLQAVAEAPPLGRASHALLLDAVRGVDAALADELHAGSDLRPFTASDLIGYSRKSGVKTDRTYLLRFTALTAPVAKALLAATAPTPTLPRDEPPAAGEGVALLRIGSEVRLADLLFRVEAVDTRSRPSDNHHPAADIRNYEDLSAPWLLGRVAPDQRIGLRFLSPTTFKSEGRHVPVPLPSLVFGSLLEKWNAFAPIAFPPEARRYADECLALSSYQLKSRIALLKEGGLRIGAVGFARYTATNYDRYWLSLMHLLADFAFFAGVGAGTSMGLGQCRRED